MPFIHTWHTSNFDLIKIKLFGTILKKKERKKRKENRKPTDYWVSVTDLWDPNPTRWLQCLQAIMKCSSAEAGPHLSPQTKLQEMAPMPLSSLLLFLSLFSLRVQAHSQLPSSPSPLAPLAPALFVVGDSTVDCGTNNHLLTLARADRPPYGRDFDTRRPTGRFSNGRVVVDYLGLFVGLSFSHFSFLFRSI